MADKTVLFNKLAQDPYNLSLPEQVTASLTYDDSLTTPPSASLTVEGWLEKSAGEDFAKEYISVGKPLKIEGITFKATHVEVLYQSITISGKDLGTYSVQISFSPAAYLKLSEPLSATKALKNGEGFVPIGALVARAGVRYTGFDFNVTAATIRQNKGIDILAEITSRLNLHNAYITYEGEGIVTRTLGLGSAPKIDRVSEPIRHSRTYQQGVKDCQLQWSGSSVENNPDDTGNLVPQKEVYKVTMEGNKNPHLPPDDYYADQANQVDYAYTNVRDRVASVGLNFDSSGPTKELTITYLLNNAPYFKKYYKFGFAYTALELCNNTYSTVIIKGKTERLYKYKDYIHKFQRNPDWKLVEMKTTTYNYETIDPQFDFYIKDNNGNLKPILPPTSYREKLAQSHTKYLTKETTVGYKMFRFQQETDTQKPAGTNIEESILYEQKRLDAIDNLARVQANPNSTPADIALAEAQIKYAKAGVDATRFWLLRSTGEVIYTLTPFLKVYKDARDQAVPVKEIKVDYDTLVKWGIFIPSAPDPDGMYTIVTGDPGEHIPYMITKQETIERGMARIPNPAFGYEFGDNIDNVTAAVKQNSSLAYKARYLYAGTESNVTVEYSPQPSKNTLPDLIYKAPPQDKEYAANGARFIITTPEGSNGGDGFSPDYSLPAIATSPTPLSETEDTYLAFTSNKKAQEVDWANVIEESSFSINDGRPPECTFIRTEFAAANDTNTQALDYFITTTDTNINFPVTIISTSYNFDKAWNFESALKAATHEIQLARIINGDSITASVAFVYTGKPGTLATVVGTSGNWVIKSIRKTVTYNNGFITAEPTSLELGLFTRPLLKHTTVPSTTDKGSTIVVNARDLNATLTAPTALSYIGRWYTDETNFDQIPGFRQL